MSDVHVERRNLLKGFGLGAGLGLAGVIFRSETVTANENHAISGTVDWLDPSSQQLGVRTAIGVTVVRLTEDAVLWRDERATLDDFKLGDEVSAEGQTSADSFTTNVLLATMHSLVATVESRDRNALYTDTETILLNKHSRPQAGPGIKAKPLNKIEPGDRVVARGRRDMASGALIGFRVGVESTS